MSGSGLRKWMELQVRGQDLGRFNDYEIWHKESSMAGLQDPSTSDDAKADRASLAHAGVWLPTCGCAVASGGCRGYRGCGRIAVARVSGRGMALHAVASSCLSRSLRAQICSAPCPAPTTITFPLHARNHAISRFDLPGSCDVQAVVARYAMPQPQGQR